MRDVQTRVSLGPKNILLAVVGDYLKDFGQLSRT